MVPLRSFCVHAKSLQLCPTLCDPMDCVAHPVPLSMGFSRQEYWSGWPFPPPGDLPNPGIEPTSPAAPALQADSLLLSHRGNPKVLPFYIVPNGKIPFLQMNNISFSKYIYHILSIHPSVDT